MHTPGVPTYVAFLRAINLGAKRKFPQDAIKTATEAAGGSDVETYINTGNVRLTHPSRSVAALMASWGNLRFAPRLMARRKAT